jgi:hypothetical protein
MPAGRPEKHRAEFVSQASPNEHSSRDREDDPVSDLTMLVSFSGHCSYLLTALIVMLFIYPFLQGSLYEQTAFGLVNTTLTSTGYGDVVLAAPYSRSLSILEQLLGVFFVAAPIARVADLYPADLRRH